MVVVSLKAVLNHQDWSPGGWKPPCGWQRDSKMISEQGSRWLWAKALA